MGVTGLWPLLSGLGTLQPLSKCAGLTLAVDLSAWMSQARAVGPAYKYSSRFFVIRIIFYRAIELLKYGVKLLFVLDGEVPKLKQVCLQKRQTVRGLSGAGKSRTFRDRSLYKEVVELLENLGLPVIHSPGEAEKMCAYINFTKTADAVLTEDGDAFLYGAQVIMRKFDKSDTSAVRISIADIESQLSLTRRNLIAFALLSGCDYNEGGVKGVGPEHIRTLFDEMRQHCTEEEDILSRISGWKDNKRLQDLVERKKNLDCMKRETHCSQCHHTGTVTGHQSKGCKVCQTECECQADSGVSCNCKWHEQQREINPCVEELRVRQKALEDKTFTDLCEKIILEFTDVSREKSLMKMMSFNQKRPCLGRLCQSLNKFLRMDRAKVVTAMIPVLAYMQLREEFDWSGFKPISIQKACQRNFVDCYQTIWSKLDEDHWTMGEFYTVDVEENLFKTRYPELVSCFQEEIAKKKKVPVTPVHQPNIRGMLLKPGSLRKKAEHKRQNEDTPVKRSLNQQEEHVNKCKKKIDFDATGLTSHFSQKQEQDSSSQQLGRMSNVISIDDSQLRQVSTQIPVDDAPQQRQVSSPIPVDDVPQQKQLSSQIPVDDAPRSRQLSSQIPVDDDPQPRQVSSQDSEVVNSSCQSSKDRCRDEDEWHSLMSEDLFSYDDDVGDDDGGEDVKNEDVVVIVSDSQDSDSCNTLSNAVKQNLPVGLEDSESNPQSTDSDVMVVRSSVSAPDLALDFDIDQGADAPEDRPEAASEFFLQIPAEETGSTSEEDAIPVTDESSTTSVIVLHSDSDVDDETLSGIGTSARKRAVSGSVQKPAKARKYTKRKGKEPMKKCNFKSNQTQIHNYFPFKKKN
ncbi:flap endonuclease GEN homolog 1-like [Haliotis asinina]|uniref:flap endonuclease GEN homolog 1-like n=1 Tax=Haliotis asinina TaxID=109174 RepID=UPI003531D40A